MSKDQNTDKLSAAAVAAMKNAYAPYSNFKVGVALRTIDGRIFAGANFENAAYMHGYEALESAVGAMISQSGWIAAGAVPYLSDVLFCFQDRPSSDYRYLPGPLGLGLARTFSTMQTRFYFYTQGEGVFDRRRYDDLLAGLPPNDIETDGFYERARTRRERTEKIPVFTDPARAQLFDTRLNAFDPVSFYAVGAMVETECGHMFQGCNCEFGRNKCLHAEGIALSNMITALGPSARLKRITILTGGPPGFPCGGCRQYINEFATPRTEVVALNIKGEEGRALHIDLLPRSFGNADLDSARQENRQKGILS